jgi:hypothetical protein
MAVNSAHKLPSVNVMATPENRRLHRPEKVRGIRSLSMQSQLRIVTHREMALLPITAGVG